MKIMLVGGGSGGHLTPLIAVASAIKSQDEKIAIMHVGQKGEGLQEVVSQPVIDVSFQISAGKFRRYHGQSFFAHLLDVKTIALNIRDVFRFARGVIEAWRLLGKHRPDAIMLKGGFVCVPLGFAARLRKIPYITHDSDAIPGLANRLTASHALYNATALPAAGYPYDQEKTVQVGIPISDQFSRVTQKDKAAARKALSIDESSEVTCSVGGGLGAQAINRALVGASAELLKDKQRIIIHLTGKKLYQETLDMYKSALDDSVFDRQVRVIDFSQELHTLSAAADVVVTRGGATNIAEFATQAKPTIVIPAPHLTGGQQLHNARVIEENDAAIVLHEDQLSDLGSVIDDLLNHPEKARAMGDAFTKLSIPGSAEKLADILMSIAQKSTGAAQ